MRASRLQELIVFVLQGAGSVSQLKLAKLVYLIEWRYYNKYGRQLTKAWYLRERRGPVPATFGRELEKMQGFEVEAAPHGRLRLGPRPRFQPTFDEEERAFIGATLQRYKNKSERALLLETYLTPPMKSILKEERGGADRKHEGVVFGRFPPQGPSAARPEAETSAEYVAPEDMTDTDTVNIIAAFSDSLPLIKTAEHLVESEDGETA